jgi:hypothetical protein
MSVGSDRTQFGDGRERTSIRLPLAASVSCPHCWHPYPPERTLWISSDHPNLRGDPKLTDYDPRRFAAERFDVQGNALDACGQRAAGLACPKCHLVVPRALYEYKPFFVSIVGAPGCGKSFFLPAMTWVLRTSMPERFAVTFQDADPRLNLLLHDYEKTLFLNAKRDEPITLKKSQVENDASLYDRVKIGNEWVELARPMVFRMEPTADHPQAAKVAALSRAVCLYDNAGEAFEPAASEVVSRVTNHLEHCDLTLFLFDPTKHPRFREAVQGRSQDPQWSQPLETVVLQNTLLDNAANRLRSLRGMSLQERHNGPLVVVVTKLDAWVNLFPEAVRNQILATNFFSPSAPGSALCVLRADLVKRLSDIVRGLLQSLAPEIVNAATAYSTDVTFIPVSATGCNVQRLNNPDGTPVAGYGFGVRPRNVQPKLCELPLLVGISKAKVPLVKAAGPGGPAPRAGMASRGS